MPTLGFMRSLAEFKAFMTSSNAPNYLQRYCSNLDNGEWVRFYGQMKEPAEFADKEWLLYILKWILKHGFSDLSREVYFYYVFDAEMCFESTIKDEWLDILRKRYGKHVEETIREMLFSEGSLNSKPNEKMEGNNDYRVFFEVS